MSVALFVRVPLYIFLCMYKVGYVCSVCVFVCAEKCLATETEGFSETKPCCYFGAVMM